MRTFATPRPLAARALFTRRWLPKAHHLASGGLLLWASAHALAVDEAWLQRCNQSNNRAYCEAQGKKLDAAGSATSAATFSAAQSMGTAMNNSFSAMDAMGKTSPGKSLGDHLKASGKDLAAMDAADKAAREADEERRQASRTPEGLYRYYGQRKGKGDARADFIYAGTSQGAEQLEWMRKAADGGNADAQYMMAYYYNYGLHGLTASAKSVYEWSQKAVRGGNLAASAALANLTAKGLPEAGVASNPQEAAKIASTACSSGGLAGCLQLGRFHLEGTGVPQDGSRAVSYFTKVIEGKSTAYSLENEVPKALTELADLYAAGSLVPKDAAKARAYLDRAIAWSGPMHADAWLTYGNERIMGHEGSYGYPRDTNKGIEVFQKMSDLGFLDGKLALGTLLVSGNYGVPKDTAKGEKLVREAADAGDVQAMTNLANMFMAEQLPSKNPEADAFLWVRKAADAGDPNANYLLSMHYVKGMGTPRDVQKFATAVLKACELGSAEGCGVIDKVKGSANQELKTALANARR